MPNLSSLRMNKLFSQVFLGRISMNNTSRFCNIIQVHEFYFYPYIFIFILGYVFNRGGYVELSKKLSLPLGSTLDRY